jgi:hypothetical protein
VKPYLLINNEYYALGTGFPGSQSGRMVRVWTPEDSFVQYDITQSSNPDFDSSFSFECSGRINGGDQKNCYIYNDLIPRGLS